MTTVHPDNDTYREIARRLAQNNSNERIAMAGDQPLEDELVVHFAANTKVIPEDDGTGAYVTCSICVPNPNLEEDDDAKPAD